MRIDYVNQQIMDALVAGYPVPRYTTIYDPDGKVSLYIITTNGLVAYALEPREVCFNLARCREDDPAFLPLLESETLCSIDNMLEPTPDVRLAAKPARKVYLDNLPIGPDREPVLLARFKGYTWDTFINMDLLEAFDDAKYYQEKKNGPVAVVEDGCLVGYVMPCKCEDAAGHYTDSPSPENPLFDDEEE